MADRHLTVYDFRDIDLMMKLADEGASGANAQDLSEALGMNGDVRAIGMRLSWMKKFGMVAYDDKRHLWTVSGGGERVIESKARAAAMKSIDAVPDEQMVEVMSHVTARYRLGDPMVAHMLRREFQYGTAPRSAVWNR
jgi:hypothetical protein